MPEATTRREFITGGSAAVGALALTFGGGSASAHDVSINLWRRLVRALDLFCCAGGAARGLADSGYDIVGVDHEDQPSYPFEFIRADATSFPLEGFELIWASPPCQAFTAYQRRPRHVRPAPDLIAWMRARLAAAECSTILENVDGAPLEDPIMLCGSMFGLDVRRHRYFETSFAVDPPPCDHASQLPRFPPATNRTNPRCTVEVGVWRIHLDVQRRAMGIDWMSREELSQAIPPAYASFLARASQKETA